MPLPLDALRPNACLQDRRLRASEAANQARPARRDSINLQECGEVLADGQVIQTEEGTLAWSFVHRWHVRLVELATGLVNLEGLPVAACVVLRRSPPDARVRRDRNKGYAQRYERHHDAAGPGVGKVWPSVVAILQKTLRDLPSTPSRVAPCHTTGTWTPSSPSRLYMLALCILD